MEFNDYCQLLGYQHSSKYIILKKETHKGLEPYDEGV